MNCVRFTYSGQPMIHVSAGYIQLACHHRLRYFTLLIFMVQIVIQYIFQVVDRIIQLIENLTFGKYYISDYILWNIIIICDKSASYSSHISINIYLAGGKVGTNVPTFRLFCLTILHLIILCKAVTYEQ